MIPSASPLSHPNTTCGATRAAVGNAAHIDGQHSCWGQKQPAVQGRIGRLGCFLYLLWADTSLNCSGSPETRRCFQTSQGKVRWRKFWEYCNEDYCCSPFTMNSYFPPFPFENRLKGSWMTPEKLPLPLGCIGKDLRLGSAFCHSVSLLAKDAGNEGTTGNAESLNKEREKKMRMKSEFSPGRTDIPNPWQK